MTINWSDREQTLKEFLEDDLPFLVQSHYEETIIFLKQKLQDINVSFDLIIDQYPNFSEKIRYHLYFFFAHQMSETKLSNNGDFYSQYCLIADTYRNQYIYSFVQKQIQDQKIQQIIN